MSSLSKFVHQNKYIQSGLPPTSNEFPISIGTKYVNSNDTVERRVYVCVSCTPKEDGTGYDLKWDDELWKTSDVPTVTYGDIDANVALSEYTPTEILKMILCPYVAPKSQKLTVALTSKINLYVDNTTTQSDRSVTGTSATATNFTICTRDYDDTSKMKLTVSYTKGTTTLNYVVTPNNLLTGSDTTTQNTKSPSPAPSVTTGLPSTTTKYTATLTPEKSGNKGGVALTAAVSVNVFKPFYHFVVHDLSELDSASKIEALTYKNYWLVYHNPTAANPFTFSGKTFNTTPLGVRSKTDGYWGFIWDKGSNITIDGNNITSTSGDKPFAGAKTITVEDKYIIYYAPIDSPDPSSRYGIASAVISGTTKKS